MILRISSVVFLLAIGFSLTARADHLPEELLAKGKPETILAGINLSGLKLSDVIKLYGQPTKVEASEQNNPKIANSYDYYWVKAGLNLHILVQRLPQNESWEYVSLVGVSAGTSRRIGRTGSGLRLGGKLADIKRIYGRRLKTRKIPKLKINDVMVQWRREEYSLVATLDSLNRITSLILYAPE